MTLFWGASLSTNIPRLGALVLRPGTTEAGRVGGRGNRPGRGDANHASGLDEALPGLWTTEDRRVPPVGSWKIWCFLIRKENCSGNTEGRATIGRCLKVAVGRTACTQTDFSAPPATPVEK